jgi:putative resolvase
MSDPDVKVNVVELRDGLAPLGMERLEVASSAQRRRIVVTDYGRSGARSGSMREITATKRDRGAPG